MNAPKRFGLGGALLLLALAGVVLWMAAWVIGHQIPIDWGHQPELGFLALLACGAFLGWLARK